MQRWVPFLPFALLLTRPRPSQPAAVYAHAHAESGSARGKRLRTRAQIIENAGRPLAVDEPQAFSEWMQWCLEKPVFQLVPCSVLVFIIDKITKI